MYSKPSNYQWELSDLFIFTFCNVHAKSTDYQGVLSICINLHCIVAMCTLSDRLPGATVDKYLPSLNNMNMHVNPTDYQWALSKSILPSLYNINACVKLTHYR